MVSAGITILFVVIRAVVSLHIAVKISSEHSTSVSALIYVPQNHMEHVEYAISVPQICFKWDNETFEFTVAASWFIFLFGTRVEDYVPFSAVQITFSSNYPIFYAVYFN